MVQHHVIGSVAQREAPISPTSGLIGSFRLVSQESICGTSCILEGVEFFHLLVSVDGPPEAELHCGLVYSQERIGRLAGSWHSIKLP